MMKIVYHAAVLGSCTVLALAGYAAEEIDWSEGEATSNTKTATHAKFDWNLPKKIPTPFVPKDNPQTEEKFQLGRHLFYDTRLSGNGTFSCASCHHQDKAFADGLELPVGSTGDIHPRNSQALVNIAFNASLNWANQATVTLEQQASVPMFGEDPIELGINDGNKAAIIDKLKQEQRYKPLFKNAFPKDKDPVHFDNIIKALASFGRGLNSFNSALDRYEAGDKNAMSKDALKGRELFFSETTECFHCHGGYNFSQSTFDSKQMFADVVFFNNGLYNLSKEGDYPEGGQGIFEMTGNAEDKGRFRPPSLRNIELTAPYMHDGSIKTLKEVIRHYAAGGRNVTEGPFIGDGRLNPNKSGFIRPFELSDKQVDQMVAFLKSLTDESFIKNPRFANPWQQSTQKVVSKQ